MDETEVDDVRNLESQNEPQPEVSEEPKEDAVEDVKQEKEDTEMHPDEVKEDVEENSQPSKSDSPVSVKEDTQTDENSQQDNENVEEAPIPKEEESLEKEDEVKKEEGSPQEKEEIEPEEEVEEEEEEPEEHEDVQMKVVTANGAVPKSGKPVMAALNKKIRSQKSRSKRKAFVAMYQSEISENKIGIKLCIKKSDTTQAQPKRSRKRSRKAKQRGLTDSEDSECEKRTRKERSNNNTDRQKKSRVAYKEPEEQSCWGNALPANVLLKIFGYVVQTEGCLPTLFRLGRVCSLWRKVTLTSSLWTSLDLSNCVKERYRTEPKLKWIIENRLQNTCRELNVSNWKIQEVQCVLDILADVCPDLIGITLAGWKHFSSEHLMYLVEEFTKLERIDLSSINLESHVSKSAVGFQSLCKALQIINGRLTHLHLAHNRLAGIPQIVTTLSTYCPNLVLLDLSNVRTVSMSHGVLHIEKLQEGCSKLKILRITNSHMILSTISLQEHMDSLGFPDLEELSVASLSGEARLFDDDCLQRILKKSTKLNLLDIRGCARLTHDSLIRLPCWDLKYLFLSGCSITRDVGSGLELIASKWSHSLMEFDLAWANVQKPLDSALRTLAEKGPESPLVHLNLCGSSVSEDAVKEVLANCPNLNSINLSSCRGLPRGVKRLMQGPTEIKELRDVLKVTLKVPSSQTPSS